MKTIQVFSGIAAVVLLAGCASAQMGQDTTADIGARLWSNTCARCHNMRAAPEFAAQQWPIIVNHMRTHQDLTKSEAEAIAAYLVRLTE
jgi:nitrate/TMAO reductase-like tetraheme cytochrome c subunit